MDGVRVTQRNGTRSPNPPGFSGIRLESFASDYVLQEMLSQYLGGVTMHHAVNYPWLQNIQC